MALSSICPGKSGGISTVSIIPDRARLGIFFSRTILGPGDANMVAVHCFPAVMCVFLGIRPPTSWIGDMARAYSVSTLRRFVSSRIPYVFTLNAFFICLGADTLRLAMDTAPLHDLRDACNTPCQTHSPARIAMLISNNRSHQGVSSEEETSMGPATATLVDH